MAGRNLYGLKVLIVEDEYLLATELSAMAHRRGAEVIGPFARLQEAMAAISRCDCAILDVRLGEDLIDPVAERMIGLGKPFFYYTAYEPQIVHPLPDGRILGKHLDPQQLFEQIERELLPEGSR